MVEKAWEADMGEPSSTPPRLYEISIYVAITLYKEMQHFAQKRGLGWREMMSLPAIVAHPKHKLPPSPVLAALASRLSLPTSRLPSDQRGPSAFG